MPPLMLLAGTLLPEILKLFASDKTGSIGDKVTSIFKNVLQTDNKDEAQKKLDESPTDKAAIQLQLAQIAADVAEEQHRADEERRRFELEVLQDQVAEAERVREAEFRRYDIDAKDRDLARNRQTQLESEDSIFAYVAPSLALIITVGLGYFMYILLTTNTEIQNKDVFNTILGAVTTAFVTIVTFYFGSSIGSKEKDRMLTTGQLVAGGGDGNSQSQAREGNFNYSDPTNPDKNTFSQSKNTSSGSSSREATKLPTPTGPYAVFRQKSPQIIKNLMVDFGLKDYQAAGILGNIGWECAGFRKLQEVKPIGSGIGGWGWVQWTGPRREAFEKWAERQGLSFSSDEANYGFLKVELNGSEGNRVMPAIRSAQDIATATDVFMTIFERPNKNYAALSGRINYANIALTEYRRLS